MFDLIRLFVVLPFWGYFLLAGGIGWWTFTSDQASFERQSEIARSLETDAPKITDLSDFDQARDIHALREIHIEGWADADYNYRLVNMDEDGNVLTERFMYVLFGADDPDGAKFARAAVIMTAAQREYFSNNLEMFMSGVAGGGIVFRIAGEQRNNPVLKGRATEALDQERLWRDENFIFVRPWLEGRDVALRAKQRPVSVNVTGWGIAGFALLVGLGKLLLSRRNLDGKAKPEPQKDELEAEPMEEAPAPRIEAPNADDNSPIGRLRQKRETTSSLAVMPSEDNGGDARKMSDLISKARVLNAGKPVPGLLSFVKERLRSAVTGLRGSGRGQSSAGASVQPRAGRPVDPFDRLRQDRMR